MASSAANREAHVHLVEQLRSKLAEAALGGPERARAPARRARQAAAARPGRRSARPGSPLLEVAPLAADGMYDDDCPAAGIITGIGRVSGRECMIVANDATVKGGTYYPITVKSTCALRRSPPRTGCRASTWIDSGGPSCPARTRSSRPRPLRPDLHNQATLSAAGIPADRRGARLLHRRRRLRSRHERRGRDRAQPGHHLSAARRW